MAFVQFSKVSLAFGDRDILKDVSLHLAAGSRACLAGANGSGKSTLLKVIAGELPADSGDRAVQKDTRIAYLPQSGIVHQGKSLRDEAETAFAPMLALLAESERIGSLLEGASGDGGSVAALLEEHHRLQEQVENSGYYRREAIISSVLAGLGFFPGDLVRDTGEFSGGWQMRIALAKALLEQPDILLLDEPTNYLDIEARAWLESWLGKFPGGCLLVSHDRYFLDVTVNEVYEIFQGNLKRYVGNDSAYEKTRQAELASLLKRYAEQQEEIAKTEALIRRFRYKATKAAFAQELIKRLDKMERIEIPENLKKINIMFPPPPRSPRVALTLEGVGKSYGTRRVLSGLDLVIDSGERLVVAGPNGAGKTTLLRILCGADRGFDGAVKYGAGISVGYFSQDAAEVMQGSAQVLDFMEAETPTALMPKVRDMLGAFLFRGDDVYKPVSVLSGGEKSRLALLQMLLKPMNLLILDEPTNHLDLHSKDVLLDALRQFTGTIIFVSHDRAFMEALSTKTLELSPAADPASPARARLFYGNYGYYLEKIASETTADDSGKSVVVNTAVSKGTAEQRAQSKQRQAAARRLQRQETELLNAIAELESEKSRLETELSRPEVYSVGEKASAVQRKLDACAAAIRKKTAEWEELAAKMLEG
ncbi:MAG: ABC-F family ATP-binding cassette domain-containing protein [Treponema sp.]|jgi:ATP-binding cassette subfamily F protein 3|nr:ABC-F family ATP-binding cassette domain-containing protein [Treponema sp.]